VNYLRTRPAEAEGRDQDTPLSQLDLANRIGVTPSVVVDMLDELEALDAIRRVQDSADRRRRVIELTETGQDLRHYAGRCAHETDTTLLADLVPEDRQALRDLLGQLKGLIY
jgi:DNA-binding MarR family transcriptional regulator